MRQTRFLKMNTSEITYWNTLPIWWYAAWRTIAFVVWAIVATKVYIPILEPLVWPAVAAFSFWMTKRSLVKHRCVIENDDVATKDSAITYRQTLPIWFYATWRSLVFGIVAMYVAQHAQSVAHLEWPAALAFDFWVFRKSLVEHYCVIADKPEDPSDGRVDDKETKSAPLSGLGGGGEDEAAP